MIARIPNGTLFNCCTDFLPPDWSTFDAIEVKPTCVVQIDRGTSYVEPCQPHEAETWTVYGHLIEGGVEVLTDVSTERLAETVATMFERELQSLGLLKHPRRVEGARS